MIGAPGHDPHAVMFFAPGDGILISGDALWEDGFGVVFPALFGDLRAFAQTRSTLEAQQRSDFGEGAAAGVVGDLLTKLEGRERHELDEIDAAQRRLEAGVFGVCEACHRAISLLRLRAMPTARRCATCQAREEAAR